ncbi:MAG: PBP1A family penicillin-binding protein [Ignavibacteria bacterium]|nr:PBP1A family penicillin-binding protein [Ignavibacteria bacterium]
MMIAIKKIFTKRNILLFSIVVCVCVTAFSIWYWQFLISGLPSLEELENPKPELATKVYSIDGEILDQFFIKNRTYVTLAQIPPTFVQGLVATEDKNFYNHWGLDVMRILKAVVKNVLRFSLAREGASTITQQLARNLYLNREVSITRKLREAITAIQIERTYTKDEILEMYLNVAYFGRSGYGVSAAAQVFFRKKIQDLSVDECAILIALLKGPAFYDPYNHPERLLARRDIVLNEMNEDEVISDSLFEELKVSELRVRSFEDNSPVGIAPHFVESVRQQLSEKAKQYGFDIYRDGLSIYTTIDSRMQRHANRSVEEHLTEYQTKFNSSWQWSKQKGILLRALDKSAKEKEEYRLASKEQKNNILKKLKNDRRFIDSVKKMNQTIEVGFVALDAKTGEIRAMIGGSDFKTFKYGLNHVTQIKRQAGSIFKPFVYTVAIDNGYPPSFEIQNQPISLDNPDGTRWTPANFDGTFGGLTTLREGIKWSINLVAIRAIIELAPVNQVIDYAHRMGINEELPPYPSLALGTGEVHPLEITSAFNVFANEGIYAEPFSILKIVDKDGNIIEENKPKLHEVLGKQTAYILTTMMEDAVNGGTGTRVRNFFHRPCAGKTGTTQEYADAWFMGFTPQLTVGVWVGFDNKAVHFISSDGQGGRAAAPIFGRFAQYVYEDSEINLPLAYFQMPDGIVKKEICTETKKLALEFCPEVYEEVFNEKYLPESCDVHTSKILKEKNRGVIRF